MVWIIHSGVAHDENPPGRGSGRYPWGSGKQPFRHETKTKRDRFEEAKKQLTAKRESDINGFSDRQKRIGAVVAIGLLAGIGGLYLYKSGKLDSLISLGKATVGDLKLPGEVVSKVASEHSDLIKGDLGNFKTMEIAPPLEQTLKTVNPYGDHGQGAGVCVPSSIAGYLQQNPPYLNVKTKPFEYGFIDLGSIIREVFDGTKIVEGTATTFGKSRADAEAMLVRRFGENANGIVSIPLKNGDGHAFNFKIDSGIVTFFDAKHNREDTVINRYWGFIDPDGELFLAALDKATVKMEGLAKYCDPIL